MNDTNVRFPEQKSEPGACYPSTEQHVVMRAMLDRIWELSTEARARFIAWQEGQREIAILRKTIDALEQDVARIKRICEQPAFRILQKLDAWRLRPAGRNIREHEQVMEAVLNELKSRRPSPPKIQDEQQAPPGEINFSPLEWQLKEKPLTDARFINLIILAACHRAGSTLLQRICNARKGTLIWGEHGAALRYIADLFKPVVYFSVAAAEEREQYFAQAENPNLWIASMCPQISHVRQAVVDATSAFLGALYQQHREGHDIIGFKEVRYGRNEIGLLRRCCPNAKFLLLVRNPLNTWKSTPREWYPSLSDWCRQWRSIAQDFQDFAATKPAFYLLKYEDLIAQEPKAMSILSDVARVSSEEVRFVLSHKIGGTNFSLSDLEKELILTECREEMETLGYC